MKVLLRDAFKATVCYADIFQFPLTKEEVRRWLIGHRITRSGSLKPPLSLQYIKIGADEYYILPKRRSIVSVRHEREQVSQIKYTIAVSVAQKLRVIPTIQLVGITGGLAMNNASAHDDVDLFIVALPDTLWITRLLATVITEILRVRRHPHDRIIRNKVCLNMFVTRDALAVPKNERDLFTAHEVLQMISLIDRNNTYQQFLHANRWVETFLPQTWKEKTQNSKFSAKGGSASGRKIQNYNAKLKSSFVLRILDMVLRFELCVLRFLETPFRIVQLWYMRDRRTTEVVSDTVIRFHPRDARVWIRNELARRLARFNIPLDKIFYGR